MDERDSTEGGVKIKQGRFSADKKKRAEERGKGMAKKKKRGGEGCD